MIGATSITSVVAINAVGRRKQDKDKLKKQIVEENAKASNLTLKKMTETSINELARANTLTNDATFVGNSEILDWRDNVEHMTKQV